MSRKILSKLPIIRKKAKSAYLCGKFSKSADLSHKSVDTADNQHEGEGNTLGAVGAHKHTYTRNLHNSLALSKSQNPQILNSKYHYFLILPYSKYLLGQEMDRKKLRPAHKGILFIGGFFFFFFFLVFPWSVFPTALMGRGRITLPPKILPKKNKNFIENKISQVMKKKISETQNLKLQGDPKQCNPKIKYCNNLTSNHMEIKFVTGWQDDCLAIPVKFLFIHGVMVCARYKTKHTQSKKF